MATKEDFDIAIVGMSARVPGARNVDEFWRNLASGIESITRLSDQEILESGVPAAYLANPAYVKAAPVLDEPGHFDAAFFGFSPMEAATLDPQHRLLLELAYEALENAGHDPQRDSARVGVFTGSALNTYFTDVGLNRRLAEDYIPTLIGNDKDFLSTRISYKLNLKGPSITVQTACSTSAVAVHLACQSLLSQETDMALAGAVSVRVPHRAGYFYDGGGVVSPDAHVRAFDQGANGTVFGSGGGILVLKRLADALSDGDTIRAVIKGSAVNNDGAGKAGYTAPSVDSQADAVVEALANAGVDADAISYLEAHGSGTPVGDPIEVRALTKAFRASTKRSGYCAIGSVKTNVGHLDAAAAVAGIIKTVLALEHRQIPPSLHFVRSNPEIDFPSTPFYVNTQLREWTNEGPRRAGVMSTGMGGTNAHIVLEEAPEQSLAASASPPYLLVLSAKTETAIERATDDLREFLERNESSRLSDVAYTLQVGRQSFPFRRAVVCTDREDAAAALPDPKRVIAGHTTDSRRPVVFLLPGVGDHYVGMGHGLYESWPVFREEVDRCAHILERHLALDIRDVIYPRSQRWKQPATSAGIDLRKMLGRGTDVPPDEDSRALNQTQHVQPALFTIEWAMARLWRSLGIKPDAIMGHSLGEYVAACLAGVFSLEDALRLVVTRASLVSELPQGAMLAVTLSEGELEPLLAPDLSISLINGPDLCIVAGPVDAIGQFASMLNDKGIICRQVQNAHAFHSRMLEPIAARFEEAVRTVRLSEPAVPYFSNVTGTWITRDDAVNPSYWAQHATRTARFSDGLRELWRFKNPILLEAGPGRTLGVLAMQHPDRRHAGDPVVLSSIRHHYENRSDVEFAWNGVARLWVSGSDIKWDGTGTREPHRRVPLPTYPFERQYYWMAPSASRPELARQPTIPSGVSALDEWFYVPTWNRKPFPSEIHPEPQPEGASWLVVGDGDGRGARVKAELERLGFAAEFVCFGKEFRRRHDGTYELNPGGVDDYLTLFRELQTKFSGPLNIVHLGALTGEEPSSARRSTHLSSEDCGFYSLLHIAQAIGELNLAAPIKVGVVSNRIHAVIGSEALDPDMATALGPCGVIPKEFPNVTCFNIDLEDKLSIDEVSGDTLTKIISEFVGSRNRVVAYRGKYRWERGFQQVRLLKPALSNATNDTAEAKRLRRGGVYLISGGTGGLGLAFAKYLATSCQPHLVLIKKTAFPAKSTWRTLTDDPRTPVDVRRTLEALLELESLGARIEVRVADSADTEQMQAVLDETLARLGAIHGVIHAAGIVSAGLIQTKTRATAESVLGPKVKGTRVLFDLLKNVDLDFLILFSSVNSVLAPDGLVDYVAANSFLDAFAPFANAQRHFRTLTINWPGWKQVGILADMEPIPGVPDWKEDALARAITTDDGLEAFRRILNSDLTQVVVSPESFTRLVEQAQSPDPTTYPPRSVVGRSVPALRANVEGPRDETEAQVARVWRDALGIDSVGIHDSFQELGGHSLLAVRMVIELRKMFQINLPMRALFDAPTVAELSRYIKEYTEGGVSDRHRAIVPLQPGGTRTPVFGVAGLGGDVITYRFLAKHLGEDQPLFGLEPPGLDGQSEPLTDIEEIAAYFAAQIRAFKPDGPYIIAGVCSGGMIAFELAKQLQKAGATISFVAMFGAPYPTIYRTLPLFQLQAQERVRARMNWGIEHILALSSLPLADWRSYLAETLRKRRERLDARSDQAFLLRVGVEQATLKAASRYTPEHFGGRVVLFLPGREWVRSTAWEPLRWREVVERPEEYFGPDDCNSDIMLLEPYAATFAELFKRATTAR